MSYNSILNGDNVETNWDLIKSEIEVLHSTWNTIVLDLNQKNLNEQDITNFGSELDSTTIAIKEENTEKINSPRNKILFELNILEQRTKDAINDIADLKIKKKNLIKKINEMNLEQKRLQHKKQSLSNIEDELQTY